MARMGALGRGLLLFALPHLALPYLALPQQAPPQQARAEDAAQFVREAVAAELKADQADHSRWLYYEVDRKPENSVKQWVAETAKGDLKRVVESNGRPVAAAQQRQAMEQFIHNGRAQARAQADARHDDEQATALLKLLPDAFVWSMAGTRGANTIAHFRPRPDYRPPTREARVFAAMEGDLAVNTAQHRIAAIQGRLVRDVKFGGGLFGRLKAGGGFDVTRSEVAPGAWQITATHVHIQGRILMFKRIAEEEDDQKSRFQPLPAGISLEEAEKRLLEQGF